MSRCPTLARLRASYATGPQNAGSFEETDDKVYSSIPIPTWTMSVKKKESVQSHRIVDGHCEESIPAVRELFLEYSAWLGVNLCFQDFEAELATLPGKYAPPAGAILLAHLDGALAGCVALRPLAPSICEMKRLWVRESFRDRGFGKLLVEAILDRARATGYARLRLDTLPQMKAALALYRELGFYEVPAYYNNPLPSAIYLEKELAAR
jgi:putative acetyltransferase